ncbi:MAG: hypothetical protein CM15mP77_1490 [Synechococcus sp.]|nr:MAG: hypothetical protein CM15mP77_1490 [Synechococcus sp.]
MQWGELSQPVSQGGGIRAGVVDPGAALGSARGPLRDTLGKRRAWIGEVEILVRHNARSLRQSWITRGESVGQRFELLPGDVQGVLITGAFPSPVWINII